MVNLLQLGDTKAQLPCRCNVSWLTEKQIFRRIVKEYPAVWRDAFWIVLPQGRNATFMPLLFDCLEFDGVHGDGIGSDQEHSRLIDKVLHLCERPAMPHLPHAVHDVQYSF